MANREALLARTFVEVADTLVADFDVVDFLTTVTTRCADLFDASEAGIMLADRNGTLQVGASSSPSMNVLELFELQHDEGPCVDCYRTGQPVRSADLTGDIRRWPSFAPEALAAGFVSVAALPLRLRDQTIGSLNLLCHNTASLGQADLVVAQALADVATIGLLQHRAAIDAEVLTGQLQYALNSRVLVEQAKGALAQMTGLSIDAAFEKLRNYSRDHNERLVEVARRVLEHTLTPDEFR